MSVPYVDDPLGKEGAGPHAAADRISQILGRLHPATKGMAYISTNEIGQLMEPALLMRDKIAQQGTEIASRAGAYDGFMGEIQHKLIDGGYCVPQWPTLDGINDQAESAARMIGYLLDLLNENDIKYEEEVST